MTQTPAPQEDQPLDGPDARFEDALLDKLTGEWRLSRKIRHRLEENHLHAGWILNHQFFQIHMQDVQSPPGYEALVLVGYNHERANYVAYWLDTFGGKFSEKGVGVREGNAIKFTFIYPEGSVYNTITWSAESQTWQSLIEQQDAHGQRSVFAEDTLRRS